MGWQKATGYNARARAEAGVSRHDRASDDGPRSRTDRRRATEVYVGVRALDRLPGSGRPNHARVARPETESGAVRP